MPGRGGSSWVASPQPCSTERSCDGDQVLLNQPVGVGLRQPLLTEDGELVGAGPSHLRVAVVQVLRGRAHDDGRGVDEPLGEEPWVGVDALTHRVMAHMLDAARDRHVVRAKGNARRRRRHRRHGAGAHPVDRVSRHRGRQAREDRRGASDGEALVSPLCGRRDGDIVDTVGWQLRIAPQQLANDRDHHVVGTSLGIEPGRTGLAERGPHAVDEDDLT